MTQMHPRNHAQHTPDKAALIMADTGEAISYRELIGNADRAAQLFQQLGVAEGDTIAIFLENHLRFPELCWAAKNSGITYACISSKSSVEDAAYIVENSDARLLISSRELADIAVPVAELAGTKLRYLMVDGARGPFESYESLLAEQAAIPLSGRRRGPSMLYSSGTTGRPKGVRTLLASEPPEVPPRRHQMLKKRYQLDADTCLMNPGPFYHASPGRFMMSVQRCGGTVIGFKKFDAQGTLAAIERYEATHGVFVPTMLIRMLKLPDEIRAHYDLSSLRCAIHLAAPCPTLVKEQMIEWWGPIIEELYAGTESVGHTMISSAEWLTHKGSVGKASEGCQIRILDENLREVPPLTAGQIYMSNGHRFEYHKDEAKTDSVYTEDGWATIGDIGYLDEEGYLYLTDRKAYMIISGGVNIYPQEAENILITHPAVADVAVIGVPNADFGEEVKAVVQARDATADTGALEAELIAYCRSRISTIKCPRSIDFVDELPRNEAGKLLKRLVKDRYWPKAAE